MPIVAPNEGLDNLLALMIQIWASGEVDWELMLWDNDIVPDQDIVYADLNECTFGGYSRETIDHTLWVNPTIVSDRAVSTYTTTPLYWDMSSGSGYVYGYALVTVSSPEIRVVERFSTPEPISVPRRLYLLPRITMETAPAP